MGKKRVYIDDKGSFTQNGETFYPVDIYIKCVNNVTFKLRNGEMIRHVLRSIDVDEEYKATHESKNYYIVKTSSWTGMIGKQYFRKCESESLNSFNIFGRELKITDEQTYKICDELGIDVPNIYELRKDDSYWSIDGKGHLVREKVNQEPKYDLNYQNSLKIGNVFLTKRDASIELKQMKKQAEINKINFYELMEGHNET